MVKTRQTESGITITVADTGAGFKTDSNNEPHIALANIKERHEIMCGATLEINSKPGKTTVTIFMPDKA